MNAQLPPPLEQRIGSRADEPERYGYVNGWNACLKAAAALAAPKEAGDQRQEGAECPICEGTGRVDSVREACGPPRHLDEPQRCNRPPAGWYCGLERGHDGSCPAWPVSHEAAAQAASPPPEAAAAVALDILLQPLDPASAKLIRDYIAALAAPTGVDERDS